MKKASFIIPVYNCRTYIEGCVAGIQNMQLEDYEILLIDDGSTDGSGEVCDRMSEQRKHIRVFHQKNQGVSAARNRGLEVSEGEMILFLDADDTIEPELLCQLLQVMGNEDAVDLLIFGMSFDYYYRGRQYRRDDMCYPETGVMTETDWENEFYQLYLHNAISPVWNKIYRRSILMDHHIRFHEGMFLYEDLEFVIRYMACCNSIYNSEQIVYHYRQQEDEGNAKRRLHRIEHLPELLGQIEDAFLDMEEHLNFDDEAKRGVNDILMHLYLVLAREKVSISDHNQIRQIGQEMSCWLQKKPDGITRQLSAGNREFVRRLTCGQTWQLMAQNQYTKIRHYVAVRVKNSKLYKRR